MTLAIDDVIKNIQDFLNYNSGFLTLIAIIVAIIPIILYLRDLKKKSISYIIVSKEELLNVKENVKEKLKIFFEDLI